MCSITRVLLSERGRQEVRVREGDMTTVAEICTDAVDGFEDERKL